jgi:hypothetical protein
MLEPNTNESALIDYYFECVEPHFEDIHLYDGFEEYIRSYNAIPGIMKHLIVCNFCYGEIINGGFLQFYQSATGVMAPEVALGFSATGNEDLAALVGQTMRFFGSAFPRDSAGRDSRIASCQVGQKLLFEVEDRQFYKIVGQTFEDRSDRYFVHIGRLLRDGQGHRVQ